MRSSVGVVEIEVWLFVVSVLAAFLVGAVLVGVVARHRLRSNAATSRETADRLKRAEADVHESQVESRRYAKQIQELTTASEDSQEALVRAEADLAALKAELELRETGATATERQLADFRKRFNDVVGLESEIATLRVIAARVPLLEAELAATQGQTSGDDPEPSAEVASDTTDARVIDLRDGRHQAAE